MPIFVIGFAIAGVLDVLIMKSMLILGSLYSIINITGMVIYGIVIFRRVETLRRKQENYLKTSLIYDLWKYKV